MPVRPPGLLPGPGGGNARGLSADNEDVGSRERWGGVLVGVGLVLLGIGRQLRPLERPRPERLEPRGIWVETSGVVPRPGVRRLREPATVARALALAGARCQTRADTRRLRGGERLHVEPGPPCSVRVGRMRAGDRLVLGLPLDPNRDDAEALALLPGLGEKLSQAVVRGRPYRAVQNLVRVRGIGPKTLARLRPYLTISEVSLEVPEERSAQRDGDVDGEAVEVR